MSQQPGSMYPSPNYPAQDWRNPNQPSRRRDDLARSSGLSSLFSGRMLLGLAALALGVKIVVDFGPDLVRYIKIRNM